MTGRTLIYFMAIVVLTFVVWMTALIDSSSDMPTTPLLRKEFIRTPGVTSESTTVVNRSHSGVSSPVRYLNASDAAQQLLGVVGSADRQSPPPPPTASPSSQFDTARRNTTDGATLPTRSDARQAYSNSIDDNGSYTNNRKLQHDATAGRADDAANETDAATQRSKFETRPDAPTISATSASSALPAASIVHSTPMSSTVPTPRSTATMAPTTMTTTVDEKFALDSQSNSSTAVVVHHRTANDTIIVSNDSNSTTRNNFDNCHNESSAAAAGSSSSGGVGSRNTTRAQTKRQFNKEFAKLFESPYKFDQLSLYTNLTGAPLNDTYHRSMAPRGAVKVLDMHRRYVEAKRAFLASREGSFRRNKDRNNNSSTTTTDSSSSKKKKNKKQKQKQKLQEQQNSTTT